ncbi:C5orf35 [Perilla frutescens var. frutescens]|nr:C5orf35 [Perilla frutescens var. frutescens]
MTVYSGTAVAETKLMKRCEVSQKVKDLLGYTLEVEPSQIQDKDASQGLFLDGEADLGTVIAIYPGVTYSPAYYQYIPRYPRVDLHNPYLITRYDGTVINAQPWGTGGEAREMWDGSSVPRPGLNAEGGVNGSDRMWKLLSKPLDGSNVGGSRVEELFPKGETLWLSLISPTIHQRIYMLPKYPIWRWTRCKHEEVWELLVQVMEIEQHSCRCSDYQEFGTSGYQRSLK